MRHNYVSFAGIVSLIALSACTNSGGAEAPDFSTTAYLTHDALEIAMVAAGGRGVATPEAAVPTIGTATYVGNLEMEEFVSGESPNDINGSLVLDVGFAANSLAGRVTDIAGRDGGQFAGELLLSNGLIDRTSGATTALRADLDGEILNDNGVVVVVDAALDGGFTTANAQYVDGLVIGTMTRDGVAIPIGDGDFIAEVE